MFTWNKQTTFFEWEMICIFMFTNNNGSFVPGIFICMLFEPLDITYTHIYMYYTNACMRVNVDENIYFIKKPDQQKELFLFGLINSYWVVDVVHLKFVMDVITAKKKNGWKNLVQLRACKWQKSLHLLFHMLIKLTFIALPLESHEHTQYTRHAPKFIIHYYRTTEIIIMIRLCKCLCIFGIQYDLINEYMTSEQKKQKLLHHQCVWFHWNVQLWKKWLILLFPYERMHESTSNMFQLLNELMMIGFKAHSNKNNRQSSLNNNNSYYFLSSILNPSVIPKWDSLLPWAQSLCLNTTTRQINFQFDPQQRKFTLQCFYDEFIRCHWEWWWNQCVCSSSFAQ